MRHPEIFIPLLEKLYSGPDVGIRAAAGCRLSAYTGMAYDIHPLEGFCHNEQETWNPPQRLSVRSYPTYVRYKSISSIRHAPATDAPASLKEKIPSQKTVAGPISVEEIEQVIDFDKTRGVASSRIDDYMEMCKSFSPDERALVLLGLLEIGRDPMQLLFPKNVSLEDGRNIHQLSNQELETWKKIVRLVGATKSPLAFETVHRQYTNRSLV